MPQVCLLVRREDGEDKELGGCAVDMERGWLFGLDGYSGSVKLLAGDASGQTAAQVCRLATVWLLR